MRNNVDIAIAQNYICSKVACTNPYYIHFGSCKYVVRYLSDELRNMIHNTIFYMLGYYMQILVIFIPIGTSSKVTALRNIKISKLDS